MYSGAEKYLFIAKETTFGTAGATKAYARVTGYGVRGTPEVKRLDEHLGQPDHTGHVRNKLNVAGQIAGKAYGMGAVPVDANGAVPLEQWWDWAYTRTSAQLASLTGEWSGGDDPLQHLGMRINQFSIEASADGGEVGWTAQILGRDEIELASATSVPGTDPYGATSGRRPGPMVFQQAASLFEVDDVVKKFTSWRLSLDNKLAVAWLGAKSAATGYPDCQIIDQSKPTRRDGTAEIKALVDDQFWADKVRADTRVKIEFAVQGYKDATNDRRGIFTVRGCVPSSFVYEENLDGLGFVTVPILIEKLGTNELIESTWSNVVV